MVENVEIKAMKNKWKPLPPKPPEPAVIYALINPFNNKIFYIGSTKRTLDITLKRHMSIIGERGVNAKKRQMIKKIVDRGGTPVIKCIFKCNTSNRYHHEKRFLNKYFFQITNIAK